MPFSKAGKYQAPKVPMQKGRMNTPKPGRVGRQQPSPIASFKRPRVRNSSLRRY